MDNQELTIFLGLPHRSGCEANVNEALSRQLILRILKTFSTHLLCIPTVWCEIFGYPSPEFSDLWKQALMLLGLLMVL